jgi:hypothetical protein
MRGRPRHHASAAAGLFAYFTGYLSPGKIDTSAYMDARAARLFGMIKAASVGGRRPVFYDAAMADKEPPRGPPPPDNKREDDLRKMIQEDIEEQRELQRKFRRKMN